MYRLLFWSIVFSLLPFCALAEEGSRGVPARLQRDQVNAATRHIGEGGLAPDWNKPEAFQAAPNVGERVASVATRQPAAVSPAAHQSPPAETANGPATSGSPLQSPGPLATAAQPLGKQSTTAPPPLPIARNGAAPLPADRGNDPIAATDDNATAIDIDSFLTVAGSLGIVLGLFLVTIWCLRRGMPKSTRSLPPEVVEVLGRAPLAGRQQMHLIRFGNKLVLATVSPAGVDSISEITDPIEVNRLAGYCEGTRAGSATASFRGILDRLDERDNYEAPEEYQRRPKRDLTSVVGLKCSRAEDDYV
jgi:flagellar biogenesis protein FliO